MTNATIFSNSINQWATPIIKCAIDRMANQNIWGYFVSGLIPPDKLMESFHNFIAVPTVHEYVKKLPDNLIPDFVLSIIDGVIEHRVTEGPIEVPFIKVNLGPDSFRELKRIVESNFAEYGEQKIVKTDIEKDEVKPEDNLNKVL